MRSLFESPDPDRGTVSLVSRAASRQTVCFEEELRAVAAERGMELLILVGRDVSVCASTRFVEAARAALPQAGVPRRRTRIESFAC